VKINRALARYLPAPVLVNLGLFIHVLLFNLYLADQGLREDFMGRQTALMTLGTALGTFPWAILVRRFGLRLCGILTTCGLAAALIFRVQAGTVALSGASVLTGLFLGGWLVTNNPAIAALSSGAGGFSLNIGFSIAIGTVGGFVGGSLPGWIQQMIHQLAPGMPSDPVSLKRTAMMTAALPILAATAVLSGIRFPAPHPRSEARLHSSRRFLLRFLPAIALWYAFCAGFIPFFNAYLRNRMGGSVAAIGGAYAFSHLPQAAATLLMPLVIARLGLVRSVVTTQILAALGVLAMLQAQNLTQATLFYTVYISLQVMSEPGLINLLMRGVPVEERPAAMAANLLLLFGINATVGAIAGGLIVQRGYAVLFTALSVTGLAAATLFAFLFRSESLGDSDPRSNAPQNSAGRHESSADAAPDRAAPG
jgi:MFS family permease